MLLTYFAFGSNMASQRLLQRIPGALNTGTAKLNAHRLSFRMNLNNESGKCDISETGDPEDFVLGVTYQISFDEKLILDQYESLGTNYDDKLVDLELSCGSIIEAVTYYALITDENMIPFDWYKNHVVRGAIENNLPSDYIQSIANTKTQVDSDLVRAEREFAIY